MLRILRDLIADDSGATAVEYALIAGLISITAIASLTAIGNSEVSLYNRVLGDLFNARSEAIRSAAGLQSGDGN